MLQDLIEPTPEACSAPNTSRHSRFPTSARYFHSITRRLNVSLRVGHSSPGHRRKVLAARKGVQAKWYSAGWAEPGDRAARLQLPGALYLKRPSELRARRLRRHVPEYRRQSAGQRLVLVLEAAGLGFVRQHALSSQQQFVSKLASEPMQHRRGYSQQRRAMQGAPERLCEGRIPHRRRCRPIYSAAELRARNDVRDQPDEVVTLDPRHPLLTAADRTAEAELERRKQIAEHPGLSAKHETDAQPDDAHSELLSLLRRAFPGVANAVAEAALTAVKLRERLVAPCAVPPDR